MTRIRIAIAVVALSLVAAAPAAADIYDQPFTDYQSSPADQYGSPSTDPDDDGNAGDTDDEGGGGIPGGGDETGGAGTGGGDAPVRVAAGDGNGTVDGGKMPYTGTELTWIVLLGVALLAAGLFVRFGERRWSRRRRRTAAV